MLDVLLVTFPFFALVFAGYVAARRRMLPIAAIPGLNSFVLYFALPCMLYRFGASLPIGKLLDPTAMLVYLPCALLLVALLGANAAGPAIVTILVDLVITSSLCIALSRLDSADEHGAEKAGKNALKGMALNPMPWAIILGGLASAFQFQLVKPVMATLSLLADAASPVALFTIGAVLARSQIVAAAEEHGPMPARDFVPVAVAKLLVHPLLVVGVGSAAAAVGLPVDGYSLTVMTLVAALPSASNVSLLAERFQADTGRIARIILLTTAAAFLTFSGAVAVLH